MKIIYRYSYAFIGHLAIPFVLCRLLLKSLFVPPYRRRWNERFSVFKNKPQEGGIWIHAVSYGEVLAAIPLIKALRTTYPNLTLTVTTTTPTGSNLVLSNFSKEVFHVYAPYDLGWIVKRFLRRVRPRLVIFIETEVWPNIIENCKAQNIPVILTNARMSKRSARRYAKFYGFFREIFSYLTVLAQAKADAKRFLKLGVQEKKIHICGSVKYDLNVPDATLEQVKKLRHYDQLTSRKIWIVASTHEGEEEFAFKAYLDILLKHPEVLLILVPRHTERCQKIMSLGNRYHLNILLRSEIEKIEDKTQVLLVNTMGELLSFYAISEIVLIGGSLVPHGGHNPLEAAIFSKPILSGHHVFNFKDVFNSLKKAHAVQFVDEHSLAQAVVHLLNNPDLEKSMGVNAKKVLEKNRGALQKQFNVIKNVLS